MRGRKYLCFTVLILLLFLLSSRHAHATVFGHLQGIVHDPEHRPISDAQITIHAVNSHFVQTVRTNQDGYFSILTVPLGDYKISITNVGFNTLEQTLTVFSNTSPILHFQLQVGKVEQSVKVNAQTDVANVNSVTPTTLIGRLDIAQTPGADRTNSLAMITNNVPGAYIVHDMLHIRGGHQVSWEIDGVEIPNTNIASSLGPQIDPKDIDYLEAQRGSYDANVGDRTYGVFNVSPRTGFERDNEAELVLNAGSYYQTNDQFNFGGHTEKFAYYASLNGNRTNYGLMPPIEQAYHDAANGYGGFSSLVYNRTPRDQFRLVSQLRKDYYQIPYDPNSNDYENGQYDSSGLRDSQHELDGFSAFSWVHTFKASTVLQLSPFYHYNSADYRPNANDIPVATTSDRASNYAGLQASITTQIANNTLEAGFYSFGQHDSYAFGAAFNPGPGPNDFLIHDAVAAGLTEEYVSDNYKATRWLTLIAGLRESQFIGDVTEIETNPRFGIAVQIPKLNWVFRAFYGRYYQPPPLLTASGPLIGYAKDNNTNFVPLRGERDEEHQFGLQIPFRGWLLDADNFETRANNFLDHSNVGESNIFFPVTIDGALIQGWELTLRSPTLWRFGQAHLAYSNQLAQQRGPITGGLICYPLTSPECEAGFNYTPLDHDQRNTLNVGMDATLPDHAYGSFNFYYGSGFHNGDTNPDSGYPGDYLPHDTNLSLALGKTFRQRTTISVNVVNATNHRVLLDNSLTFGGFHYNTPREIYGEVRYRFHYDRLFHK